MNPGRSPITSTALALPAFLAPGARVRVVAASGPFDIEPFTQGIRRLEQRYLVHFDPKILNRTRGYLAGSDDERLRELQSALDDPAVDAVWLARGGFGLSRIVSRLSLEGFRSRPKWFVGFSDATVLHLGLHALGFSSLHAANVTGVSSLTEGDWESTLCGLEGRNERLEHSLLPLNPAAERGTRDELPPVFGGNLTVLFAEAAAGRLTVPLGATLLLEDVSETSYRVDRMLTALEDGGHLSRAGAIVLGDFWQCSAGKFGVPVEDVLRERFESHVAPAFWGARVGHATDNRAVVLGRPLRTTLASL